MFEKLVNLFKKLRKPKKKEVAGATPQIEGDTIEQCPHVASGERKVYASTIQSVSSVKDVCKECFAKAPKRKPMATMLISKPKHPKPSSKFFKPESAHAKRLRKPGAKLEEDEED